MRISSNLLFCSLCLGLSSFAKAQKNYTITSPNQQLSITVAVGDSIYWSLSQNGKPLVASSSIGLQIENKPFIGFREKVKSSRLSEVNDVVTAVVPVIEKVSKNVFHALQLNFKSGNSLLFRLYDNGAAYRWQTTAKDSINVTQEVVNFKLPLAQHVLWGTDHENQQYQSHYEQLFKDTTLASYTHSQFCDLPLYVATTANTKLLITESDLHDYPNLFLHGTSSNTLTSGFPKVILQSQLVGDRGIKVLQNANYIARTSGTRSFPWRVVMVAAEDKDLLSNNLVYLLGEPNKIKDPSWIHPGKVSWDWWNDNNIYGVDFKSGLNTETYKYYIDFASKYHLPYIILDEGWSRTTTDVMHARQDIDIPTLVQYGKSKNVGVILWSLWQPMDENMEALMSQYEAWGVKGIKVDFMARADQYMVNFYDRFAQTAAKHHLLVDFHGAFKPVGLNRTYPNVLSYEGVKGLENYKWTDAEANPPHDVTIPFTRMAVGPMDYTPGAMRNVAKSDFRASYSRPMSEGTRAHQAAMYVVFTSPLQMLSDNPSNYLQDSLFTSFIAQFPTTWDQSIPLQGDAGQYVAVARKSGTHWYLGAMTNWTERDLELKLDFLANNKTYKITILQDGINADKFPEDYKMTTQTVTSDSILKVHLAKGGGWTAVATPID